MAVLDLPRIWTRQPVNALGINQGHPLASSLIFYAYPMGGQVVDLVSGNIATPTGAGTTIELKYLNGGTARPTDSGILCATTVASTSAWSWAIGATGLDSSALTSAPFSLFSLSMATQSTVTATHICSGENGLGNCGGIGGDDNVFIGPGYIVGCLNTTTPQRYEAGLSGQLTTTPTNRLSMFGFGTDGSNIYTYYQGKSRNSYAIASTIGAGGVTRVTSFGRSRIGGTIFGVAIGGGFGFNRVLTANEYALLWNNPWALVRPQTRKIWIPSAAGGGTVYNVSVAETMATSDATTAAAIFNGSVSETMAAADGDGAAAIYNAAVTDSVATSDTTTASTVYAGTVAELMSVVDANTANAVFTGSVSELISALDTPSTSANVFNGSVAETLTAVDTQTGVTPGGGNTVTILSGVSILPWDGVTKRAILLTPLGGSLYTVTYVNSVSDNRIDSVHNEWYIIT